MPWPAPLWRRVRRFGLALRVRTPPAGASLLADYLDPAQIQLFSTMQPADQQHSLEVFERLRRAGHHEPELLQAALLHDVGKARAHLHVWHRVLVDLGQAFWPAGLRWLAARGPRSLREPLDVALRHPELGAEDAGAAGCSERVQALIRGDARRDLAELAEALWRSDSQS